MQWERPDAQWYQMSATLPAGRYGLAILSQRGPNLQAVTAIDDVSVTSGICHTTGQSHCNVTLQGVTAIDDVSVTSGICQSHCKMTAQAVTAKEDTYVCDVRFICQSRVVWFVITHYHINCLFANVVLQLCCCYL